jgi:vacuolar-type H+-ATPase subunit E/Vma4
LDERVRAQVVTLCQDPAEYGPLLNNLAKEALDVLGTDKAILRVPEGETRLLVHDPRVVGIDETTDLPMGGIVAMDAETGLHLVDNSLRTRFERLKPVMVEALSARLAGHVRDAQEPLPELRLP